ncbi:MAG TPA: WD40 repeat domain-containing protein [Phototrophicaceae bacterium]|nr:WD40 repeat domain-containing protein [Phototrophicaceae bacterium]
MRDQRSRFHNVFTANRKAIIFTAVFISLIFIGGLATNTQAQQVLETLPVIEVVQPSTTKTYDFAWSHDGSKGALTVDKNVIIYDSNIQELGQLEGHTDLVTDVDWSPQDDEVVTASLDKTIRIWNVQTAGNFGDTKTILSEHSDWVFNIDYNFDGSKLASSALDITLAPTNDGNFYNTTWIWDVASQEPEIVLPSYAGFAKLDWSPNGNLLANNGFAIEQGDAFRIWDIDQGGEKVFSASLNGDRPIYDLDFSPDGQYLAIGSGLTEVLIFSLAAQDLKSSLGGDMAAITAVSWCSDGSKLAAADSYGSLSIWDVATARKLVYIEKAHTGWIGRVEWASSGTKLATLGSEDNTLRVWDVSALPEVVGVPTATPAFATDTPTISP